MIRRIRTVLVSLWLMAPTVMAFQPPPGQEDFRPASEVPPAEQLPGGVFVVVAYSFVWVATMAYIWFVWRRLRKVEDEMEALQRKSAAESR